MPKTDYISGTEDAYVIETARVQVSAPRESEKSYGCLVEMYFDANGKNTGAGRLEWFPKSHCSIEKIPNEPFPEYYLTAPKWLLDKKNVKYNQ